MQKKRHYRLIYPLLILAFLALACNFPREGTPTPSGPDMLKTYAAQTIQVQLTLVATDVQPTFTPGPIESTVTPSVPSPTIPQVATPSQTPTQGVCDQAGFEEDVTIPDNTVLEAGQTFTKTWRLRNDGVCTWNSSYAIVFERGDAMNGPPSASLTIGTVAPGETVDVSVDIIAPEDPGTYQGYWKLRNQAGQTFGLGKDRDKDFWVKIKIGQQSGLTYDFNIQAKSANWIGSGDGSSVEVPFNGADENPDGVAKLKDNFNFENGKPSGIALVTGPKKTNDGRITGTFPGYTIAEKDYFKAKLGFLENCADGKVVFQFSIKEGDAVQQLDSWTKSCDGTLVFADVDLSAHAGKNVQFVLDVFADGSPENDLVVWGSARIERE
jgi:hypothetical protein